MYLLIEMIFIRILKHLLQYVGIRWMQNITFFCDLIYIFLVQCCVADCSTEAYQEPAPYSFFILLVS